MDRHVLELLSLAEGPVFRATFALMVFGVLRWVVLSLSDATAARMSTPNRAGFWSKLRLRMLWEFVPSVVMQRQEPSSPGLFIYHLCLCGLSLIARLGVVIVPAFMAAHVHLWERSLGVRWPAFPGGVADVLAIITIIAAGALLLGRLYSPRLRGLEPAWSFAKPLVILLPFVTGYVAMHPLMSPFSYHFVMLIHVLSACLLFVMIGFGRLMSCVHTPLTTYLPEAAWSLPATNAGGAEKAAGERTVTA